MGSKSRIKYAQTLAKGKAITRGSSLRGVEKYELREVHIFWFRQMFCCRILIIVAAFIYMNSVPV